MKNSIVKFTYHFHLFFLAIYIPIGILFAAASLFFRDYTLFTVIVLVILFALKALKSIAVEFDFEEKHFRMFYLLSNVDIQYKDIERIKCRDFPSLNLAVFAVTFVNFEKKKVFWVCSGSDSFARRNGKLKELLKEHGVNH